MSMTGEVSPLGRDDEPAPPDQLRASHEDRDRVVELLRVAAGDGRLTAEELDERLEAALTARTYGELTALVKDLPAQGQAVGVPAPPPEPKELVRIECGSSVVKRDGHWVVPRRMEVQVASGQVTLDFTEAVITQPSLPIDAEVRSGGLILITKPGIWSTPTTCQSATASSRSRRPGTPRCPPSCAFRCLARSAAASSWRSHHEGPGHRGAPSGSGCCAAPSPAPFPPPDPQPAPAPDPPSAPPPDPQPLRPLISFVKIALTATFGKGCLDGSRI